MVRASFPHKPPSCSAQKRASLKKPDLDVSTLDVDNGYPLIRVPGSFATTMPPQPATDASKKVSVFPGDSSAAQDWRYYRIPKN